MKIGVIVLLAISLIIARPVLQAEAVTDFAREGTGPVFAGSLFPFVFITIACGALSGFHALISSGTTPKMIAKESQVRLIGYGGMLMESFVADQRADRRVRHRPGPLLRDEQPGRGHRRDGRVRRRVHQRAGLRHLGAGPWPRPSAAVQEDTLISRTGGAPTLAVGIAQIFSQAFGGGGQAFWYHFAIMFEALFILTAVDAGTRVGRFMLQDTVGNVWKKFGDLSWRPGNIIASAVVVGLWGSVLYIGVTDPLGGVNQLFPLFGIANQLLAAIALTLCTVLLIKHGKLRYAWVTAIPLVWDLVVTMTASWQKVFSGDPRVGYFTQANVYRDAQDAGEVLAPAQDQGQMDQIIFNSTLNGILQSVFARAGAGRVRQRRRGDHAGDPGGRAADDGGTGRAVSARRTRRALPDRRGEAGDRRARAAGRRGHGAEAAAAVTARRWSAPGAGCAGTCASSPVRRAGTPTWSTARSTGTRPMTRREFERRRSDEAGEEPDRRCC